MMSRFRPRSQPRTRTIVRFPESQAAARDAAAPSMQLDPGEVARPGLRNPEQLYGFPSLGPRRPRAALYPDTPNSSPKTPKSPTAGSEPEQISVNRLPRPPPPPARGVWYYFTVSCLSCTISCASCSITSTSGVTLVMRDSAKRLYSASFAAI